MQKKDYTIASFIVKYKSQLIISSIAGTIYNTFIVLGPLFLGRLIDATELRNANILLLTALSYISITAFFQFARFVKRWFMRDQFNHVACDIREALTKNMLSRSASRLSTENAGDLMSRTVSDVQLVTDTVMRTINEGFDTWLFMVSYFVTLMLINWKVTLAASLMIPLTIIFAQRMRHLLYSYSMAVRKSNSKVNSELKRYLEGVMILRLFGREQAETDKTIETFQEQAGLGVKEMILKQSLLPIYALIAGTGVVICISMLANDVVSGAMSIGLFNSYIMMFVTFSARTKTAASVFNQWHGGKAAWMRIKEKMTDDDIAAVTQQNLVHCDKIAVKGLTFAYSDADILHDINFEARKGQIIGITGPIGCGKTALAKALTGIFPYGGSITLNDTELSDIPSDNRCSLIAYTGHEQSLFSMSVEDNITFGDELLNKTRLDDSLVISSLSNDIVRFDDGLNTVVGEKGHRVSGGQAQRIAFARAVYADTDILILDDPFSAVDIATEQNIINSMRELLSEKTVFLFTHRINIFPLLDNILLMENGRITETGNHDFLMKQDGLYKKIFTAQEFMEVRR